LHARTLTSLCTKAHAGSLCTHATIPPSNFKWSINSEEQASSEPPLAELPPSQSLRLCMGRLGPLLFSHCLPLHLCKENQQLGLHTVTICCDSACVTDALTPYHLHATGPFKAKIYRFYPCSNAEFELLINQHVHSLAKSAVHTFPTNLAACLKSCTEKESSMCPLMPEDNSRSTNAGSPYQSKIWQKIVEFLWALGCKHHLGTYYKALPCCSCFSVRIA